MKMNSNGLNALSWNVRGMSSKKARKIKRSRLRSNIRKMHPRPDLVFIQEYKMDQRTCNSVGALGIRKGKALWNGAVHNHDTNRWRGGTTIFLSPPLQHASTKSGISVLGRAHWVICNLEQR
jgi:hypothetical protein